MSGLESVLFGFYISDIGISLSPPPKWDAGFRLDGSVAQEDMAITPARTRTRTVPLTVQHPDHWAKALRSYSCHGEH